MSVNPGAADRLNEHLDAVATGDTARSSNIDGAIAATVERFFTADDAPGPPPGLAEHLWHQIMPESTPVDLVPLIPALLPDRNGRTPIEIRPATLSHRGPSALAYLATAALVLLTLVGALVALRGSLRPIDPNQRAIIPAIESTAESRLAIGSIPDVILLRAALEQMPSAQGRSHQLSLNRYQLAPGAVQPVGGKTESGVGLDVFTVEAGQLTVEADAPVLVTRAVASPASAASLVEPGTGIVLDVGDQLYAPNGVSFRRRNTGPSPATTLDFSLGAGGAPWSGAPLPAGVTADAGLPKKQPPIYPAVPAEATVHRLTLAPGDELAVRDLPGLELVYVEAGALDLVYDSPEIPGSPERFATIGAGSGTEFFGPTPERAVLANRGAQPLVILAAAVVPAGASEPTPQEPWSDGWGSGDHRPEPET